jgi:hypothetical protein
MKSTLLTGICKTSRLKIDADRTIGFMGPSGRVFGRQRFAAGAGRTGKRLGGQRARFCPSP